MKPVVGLIIGATLLNLTVSSVHAAEELTHIKVGHMVALDMAPLFVAKESGCFTRQGLDVETVFFANPGDNNAALAGGAIDFSINAFTLPFFAANSGVPIRVISAAGGWGIMEVVAQAGLGLHSIADLKTYIQQHPGKRLKIATLQGDTLELILDRQFAKNGIDPKSVQLVYFNDLLGMVEAFRSGQVDILSHIKPYTTDLEVNKGSTVLTNNAQTWSLHAPNTVVSVLDKTLTQRAPVVRKFLSGLICGADIINKHPDQAVSYLDKGHYFRVSPAVLSQAFKSAPAPISFTPDLASIQSVVDDMAKLGYIKGGVRAEDIFRLDMIRSLEKK
ncbi:TPA: ABC transporter substrate-binding protein [Klebsiella variicola]|uniref:ABC transporter substrate-binding protein n=1 Tax=Klebsiella pneumoniae TaxID=573 RepID=UPI0015E9EB09|nr:ABC transporter substrate-binding protein [Klebsiella pneumoniae]EIY5386268.1 ABC transporter substrate-binding protein [Klebsiella variicola]MDU4203455.1 ABC transporter substrate-binding protein [Negativicoccus succinicivorans]MDU4248819.1 ABC transporter substrate-binding protein [Thomasclavelia ramosa]QLR70893.1 ABC transporter substrate-binding protein [Klebsiella pneumoniae]QLR70977.1 ABC transporter substrate-binding protein [Klebsiella pneumoniae]